MKVKGFIIEDDQKREFVLVCERPDTELGKVFALRGWQRRRLVPLQYSEQELRRIIGGVLVTLDDLFKSLRKCFDNGDAAFSQEEGSTAPRLKKPPILQEVGSDQSCFSKTE